MLDPDFGEQLRGRWPGQPVWIEMSPVNEPVIRSLWANHPQRNHRLGLTGRSYQPGIAAETRFLTELDTIDLHHELSSANAPYIELELIGCRLNASVRAALTSLGFVQFDERRRGFVARRVP